MDGLPCIPFPNDIGYAGSTALPLPYFRLDYGICRQIDPGLLRCSSTRRLLFSLFMDFRLLRSSASTWHYLVCFHPAVHLHGRDLLPRCFLEIRSSTQPASFVIFRTLHDYSRLLNRHEDNVIALRKLDRTLNTATPTTQHTTKDFYFSRLLTMRIYDPSLFTTTHLEFHISDPRIHTGPFSPSFPGLYTGMIMLICARLVCQLITPNL